MDHIFLCEKLSHVFCNSCSDIVLPICVEEALSPHFYISPLSFFIAASHLFSLHFRSYLFSMSLCFICTAFSIVSFFLWQQDCACHASGAYISTFYKSEVGQENTSCAFVSVHVVLDDYLSVTFSSLRLYIVLNPHVIALHLSVIFNVC